jgi:hypothetical protein
MSTYSSIEDRVEVYRLASEIDDVDRERLNFLEELSEERAPLRRRLAETFIRLGLKIDPEAAETLEPEHTAA